MYKVGTNQYKVKQSYMDTAWPVFWIFIGLIAFAAFVSMCVKNDHLFEQVFAEEPIISPVVESKGPIVIFVTPTPTPVNPDYDTINAEIKEVFGSHYPKAMKVLSCENAHLRPDAVNTAGNTPAGSRDMGVFQINEYWQGVHAKFLLNYKTNIRIAYQIYEDSGYSFRMWSCGKRFGI